LGTKFVHERQVPLSFAIITPNFTGRCGWMAYF